MKKLFVAALFLFCSFVTVSAFSASLEEVTFLTRVETYETVADTTLVTLEGKRIPVPRGTRLNVAGFTPGEAFVISRQDKPNAFVRRSDIVPVDKAPRNY
ncbi:MAG: hypothetical protein HY695_21555 [Deltaproteobacteria bacterium]|nr:hypothetical protein [Deltaproteobacteria bacterium]